MVNQQNDYGVFVVAGAGPFSLGDAITNKLAECAAGSRILAIDIEAPIVPHKNATTKTFDLNPLKHGGGLQTWSTELEAILRSVVPLGTPPVPIRALFLSVAKYGAARFESLGIQEIADMLGTNFLAKCELISAAMRINSNCGFDNSEVLDIVDFGSLHSFRKTRHRALYNATKSASLALCETLSNGDEVRRAFHIVPGCIDTPMLHSNHWALKEHGDPQFPDLVRRQLATIYPAIFRDTNNESFRIATQQLGMAGSEMSAIFDRYRTRRKEAANSREGIILPEELATHITQLILDSHSRSGVYEVTAPNGNISVTHRLF